MSLELLAKDHELDLLKGAYDELIAAPMEFLNSINVDELEIENQARVDIYEWLDKDHSDLIYKLTARILLNKSVTAQALTGMMFSKLRHIESRGIIIDLMLNAITKNPFIKVKRIGMYLYFSRTTKLNQEILYKQAALSYVMPSVELPLMVTDNRHIGYRTINESILCGGELKHHDLPINLTHINKLNRNPYRVETRIQFLVKPKFDPTPKVKDNGEYENDKDISKRYESWNRLISELPNKVNTIALQGNRFYIHHKFDDGGRTYAKAFHFNYQGISYLKAMVQSANKEIVEPNF
ncbi:MAG: hypothetical protein ACRCVV_21935 [Shewanella sp.]